MMSFDKLLLETRYSTQETAKRLLPSIQANGLYQELEERYNLEKEKIKAKYLKITNLAEIMKQEIHDYLLKLIPAIKEMYGDMIPLDRMQKLEGLLNLENVKVINDDLCNHDFSADSEKGQIIINLAKIAKDGDMYDKLVKAKGCLPHEIFHIIIRMLKPSNLADEVMTITLYNGETIKPPPGMVGFMLNEGFVEMFSYDFCKKQETLHPGEFYHCFTPQYMPYVNICNYILRSSSTNLNICNINYEDCLNVLTIDEQKKYKEAECISYAVRHGSEKNRFGREVRSEEIAFTNVERITIENRGR